MPDGQERLVRSQEMLKMLPLYTSVDGAGLRGLDADSVNSSSDYFAYLCNHALSENLTFQTVEANCESEPC
jgi:hypothetical protein